MDNILQDALSDSIMYAIPDQLYLDNASAKVFIEDTLDLTICEPYTGFVIRRNGSVHGAFVVNNYERGLTCDITASGVGVWTPGIRNWLANFIFVGLDCCRVTAVTRPSNIVAIKALRNLGFKQEGLLRARYGNEDGLVYGLLRSERPARYLSLHRTHALVG